MSVAMPSAAEPVCRARWLVIGTLVVLTVATAGWFWFARPHMAVIIPPPPSAAAAPRPAEPEMGVPAPAPAAASERLPKAMVPATATRPLPKHLSLARETSLPRPKADSSLEFFRLGVLYQQAGNHRRAVERYKALLARDPRHVAALNNLGVSLRHLGELQAAADLLERATAVDPTYDKAFTNLGVVQQLQERSAAAMESHLRALALNGQNWESAFNLGLLFWEADDLDRASQFFLKVVSLHPHASAYYHLGQIAERQGRRNDALHRYRQALQEREGAQADLTALAEQRLRGLVGQLRP